MAPFFTFILAAMAILALALLFQGVITLLATWLVTGRRPLLGSVIKALLLAGLAYGVAIIIVLFQFSWLEAQDIPLLLLVAIIILLPVLVSVWIFARCLDITLLQAVVIVLLVNALNIGLGLLSRPWIPETSQAMPEMRQFI